MKTGDLERVLPRNGTTSQIGIIIDALEQSDGFYVLEVVSDDGHGWYCDLDLQLINEST